MVTLVTKTSRAILGKVLAFNLTLLIVKLQQLLKTFVLI
jgi:hypothetical protein